jgi:hypothetical protein
MPRHWRIRSLLIAHFVCGLLCFALVASAQASINWDLAQLAFVPFYAIIFCQASLLGIWTAYSASDWWKLVIGFVVGATYLDGLVVATTRSFVFMPIASLGSFAVAGLLLLARRPKVRLRRDQPPPSQGEGLRISVRSLMLVTLVSAIFVAGTEGIENSVQSILVAWITCFVIVGLASPWATLGPGPPAMKCLVVLSISAALGTLFVSRVYQDNIPWKFFVYMYSAFILQAILLLGSLLILRSCGYRLAALSASESDRIGEAPNLDMEQLLRDIGS